MSTAHPEHRCAALLKSGRSEQCLATAKSWVRQCPTDPAGRIGLFQLLAVAGDWQRAQQQLGLAAELDRDWAEVADAYARVLAAEGEREQVLAGRMMPLMPGQVPQWQRDLLLALQDDGAGKFGHAGQRRALALAQAEAVAGRVDGQPFAWLGDADPRFGPCLEIILQAGYAWVPFAQLRSLQFRAPTTLRDLLWQPVEIAWRGGARSCGVVPCRYPGSQQNPDGAIRLGQRTVWQGEELAARGLGQRLLATNEGEHALLAIRRIDFDAAVGQVPWPN